MGKDNNQTEKPNVLKIQNLKTETNNFAREKPIKKSENIITQKELSEKINIKKLKIEFKRDTKFNENKIATEPIEKKVSKSTEKVVSSLIANLIKNTDSQKGQGNDQFFGDKGKESLDPYSSSYYSQDGQGGKSQGFGLNGRTLRKSGIVTHKCNEEGIVVVRIQVNPQGDVFSADPGVKGSTNISPCLLEPAKETALTYKWFPDQNAPKEQVGFVVIQFKLSE